jgi:hypothetical protein
LGVLLGGDWKVSPRQGWVPGGFSKVWGGGGVWLKKRSNAVEKPLDLLKMNGVDIQ